MCKNIVLVALYAFSLSYINGEPNPYIEALKVRPWKSVQQYVEVRPGAFLFYWLYYADGTAAGADRKPLIIWVQGGPGLAATGIANFAELGPLTMDMTPRNHTWVKGRNVLLIDHPVGTGFSYLTNSSLFVTTDREMAIDLQRAIKCFFRRHKEFRKTPTYIFGQSYGGKISPRLGYYLYRAIENKRLKMNFKGIGIGSGWVDPKESSLIQPQFLYNMGVLDQRSCNKAMRFAKDMAKLIDNKEYALATQMLPVLFETFYESENEHFEINFNNINEPNPYPVLDKFEVKMNKYVKPTLSHVVNQSLEWVYRSKDVWDSLSTSLLVPSTKFLEMLLNNTKLKIAVYNGNLDVITPLAGASNWVHKLKWPGALEFQNAKRSQIRGNTNGFYKQARQLSFWGVFGSGHWVPEENPLAMEEILKYMTSDEAAPNLISLCTNSICT